MNRVVRILRVVRMNRVVRILRVDRMNRVVRILRIDRMNRVVRVARVVLYACVFEFFVYVHNIGLTRSGVVVGVVNERKRVCVC